MAKKPKAPAVPLPETEAEARALMSTLGDRVREIESLEAKLETMLAQAKADAAAAIAPIAAAVNGIAKALAAWAARNRPETGRTIDLASGTIAWRWTPPAVVMEVEEADLLADLRRRRLLDFIRVTEALDKSAVKADWDRVRHVPGLALEQREVIAVTPLRVAAPVEVKTKVTQRVDRVEDGARTAA